MYYELYIDVFFLENFMMDGIVLFLVNRIMKRNRSASWLMLWSACGSAAVCGTIFLPVHGVVKAALYYGFIPGIMLFAGLGCRNLMELARSIPVFYLSAVGMGGVMQLFRPFLRNMSFFFTAAAAGWLVYSTLLKLSAGWMRKLSGIVEVKLYGNGEVIQTKALWDTGNLLTDTISGDPVNILDPEFAARYFGDIQAQRGYRWIPYMCVGKTGVMEVFRLEKMYICSERKWIQNPLFGVSSGKISESGDYQIILNPGIQQ